MKSTEAFRVKPGKRVRLSGYDPEDTAGVTSKEEAEAKTAQYRDTLDTLQYLMFAERKHALLVILQGRDASGKDSTIRHVMSGVDPQSCVVKAFKEPTGEELAHDFLWRIHKAVPGKGIVGVFNRSHYEDVLIVRVHNLVPREIWSKRYDAINAFERTVATEGVTILKFFLHISKDEQKKRLEARLHDPTKNWKFSQADLDERKFWSDYTKAYEDAISLTSTQWAPWYVVPANHKWARNILISRILVDTLKGLKMKFPKPKIDVTKVVIE